MEMPSFLLPANGQVSPDSLARRRKMAEGMLGTGMDTSPIASPWQGAARLAQALVGGLSMRNADKSEQEGRAGAQDAMLRAMAGGTTPNDSQIAEMLGNPWMSGGQQAMVADMYKSNHPAAPDPYTLGEGQNRYDSNNQLVAQGPAKQSDSGDWGKFQADYNRIQDEAGLPKYAPEELWQKYLMLKKSTASQNTQNVNTEKGYGKKRGEDFATQAQTFDDQEAAARDSLVSMDIMEQQMSDPNFYSGFGAEQIGSLKSLMVSLGGDADKVTSMQTFATESKKQALNSMGGKLGAGFSNADRDFVLGLNPGTGNTPDAIKKLIAINRKVAERRIEVAQMARDYEIQNGQIDPGFKQQLAQWAKANPVFPQQEQPQQDDVGGWTVLPNGVKIRQK